MPDKQEPCAAYIRVSTHDQEEYSPESQIKLIKSYAENHGLTLPDAFIFRDDGISGRSAEKRPGFQRMIAAAKGKPRPFGCILVWKFSRFARNQEESIVYKSLLKKENGIEVVSISEPVADGPFGQLIERIIEWFDAFYSTNLSVEVRRGMAERAGRGLPVSAAPFGYAYKEKLLVVVPEEAESVRMVYRDFLSGMPTPAIAKKLNALGIRTKRGGAWESRSIRYLLSNPTYIGKIRWRLEGSDSYRTNSQLNLPLLTDGQHEPIVSPQEFSLAQDRLVNYRQNHGGNAPRFQRQDVSKILQGLVKCGSCGGTMTWSGTGMNCSRYIHGKCGASHFIPREKLEHLVLAALRSQLGNLFFEPAPQKAAQDSPVSHLRRQLKNRESALRRLKEAYVAGTDSLEEYQAGKSEIESQMQNIKKALSQAEIPATPDRESFSQKRIDALDLLEKDSLSPQEKNSLLRIFVSRIIFYKDPLSLEIEYRT